MTLEIIIFIAAILFGIVIYWSESKSNKIYRSLNRLTHTKALQMTLDNPKGFVYKQAFLMRLVYVTLLFVLAAIVVQFVTPLSGFFIQMFTSAIVGTLIGTYLASAVLFARDRSSKEHLTKVFDKSKKAAEAFTDDIKQQFESTDTTTAAAKDQAEPPTTTAKKPTKSARDRLKDKGMIK